MGESEWEEQDKYTNTQVRNSQEYVCVCEWEKERAERERETNWYGSCLACLTNEDEQRIRLSRSVQQPVQKGGTRERGRRQLGHCAFSRVYVYLSVYVRIFSSRYDAMWYRRARTSRVDVWDQEEARPRYENEAGARGNESEEETVVALALAT